MKRKPKLKYMIETFVPIRGSSRSDLPPAADAAWLAARGIESEAAMVLTQLRDDVAPLLKTLRSKFGLDWFAFLVHAYPLVPTTADDKWAYIHLRLSFTSARAARTATKILDRLCASGQGAWMMTRPFKLPKEVAGVSPSAFIDGDAKTAWLIMGEQSAWLLAFLTRHKKVGDAFQLVMHTRQFLHYFANAAQMRVA